MNVTTTTIVSAMTATNAVMIALASTTVCRRGQAANVGRIVPKPNSPVIDVAPITPRSSAVTTDVPETRLTTFSEVTSSLSCSAVVRMQTIGGNATAIVSRIQFIRIVRSLIHSLRRASITSAPPGSRCGTPGRGPWP